MDGNIKVSVVIPSLNVVRYIEECIDSARNQTLKDIEIICVDAGSDDGTRELLERKAKEDDRIKIVISDNRSYGKQMNIGMQMARGEYIAILEADDYIQPGAYEFFTRLADKTNADFIKSDYYIFIGDGERRNFQRMKVWKHSSDYEKCLRPSDNLDLFNARMTTWQGIYRRSFLEKNEIRHNETPGASYQDNGFWFQTMMFAERLVFSPRAFYCLRRDNAASSMLQSGKAFCIFEEYDFIRGILRAHPELESRLMAIFRKKEIDSYRGHFDRIAKTLKRDFLLRWHNLVRDAYNRGEYDEHLFSTGAWKCLLVIKDTPELFFSADTTKDFALLLEKRSGRRKIPGAHILRGLLDCLQDNGFRYTFKRGLGKIFRRRDLSCLKTASPLEMPLVSVIIPFYNTGKFAAKTLSDICGQDYGHLEIICVNDGSTDETPLILSSFASADPRVKVVSQTNAGAGAARNAGLRIATGKYALILDSDDFYEPSMIYKAVAAAEANQADITVWRTDLYDQSTDSFTSYKVSINSKLLPGKRPFAASDVKRDIFKLFIGWSWDKLFRLDYIKKLGLEFQEQRTSNDLYFVFSAIVSAKRIAVVDSVLVHHRRMKGTLAATRELSWECCFNALNKLWDRLKSIGLTKRFERDFLNYAVHFLMWNRQTLKERVHSDFDKRLVEWCAANKIYEKPRSYFYNAGEYSALLSIGH